MTTLTLTLSPVGRRSLPRERPSHSTIAVVALALPNLPDIGTIYVTAT